MKKDKLLFLIDKMENGGAERQMLKIASLYQGEYDIDVTSLYTATPSMLEQAEKLNFEYVVLHEFKHKGPLGKIFQLFESYKALQKLIINTDYYAIFSFLEWSNVLAVLARKKSRKNRIRLFLNVRNYLSNQYASKGQFKLRIAKYILPYFYNRANGVICNSHAIKQDLIANFGVHKKNVQVIYNSLDLKKITLDSQKSIDCIDNDSDHLTFVACGRLVEQKQMHSLLLSFHQYNKETNRNDTLLILGDGEHKTLLENSINKQTINAQLIGHQDNVAAWFKKADCFLLNSYFEGFPNVLAEAVALGTYVIAADCLSGPREIITNFEIIDYKKTLPNVYQTDLGVLYKSQYNAHQVNPYLVRALKSSIQYINIHSRNNTKTLLQDESFGVLPWRKVLSV